MFSHRDLGALALEKDFAVVCHDDLDRFNRRCRRLGLAHFAERAFEESAVHGGEVGHHELLLWHCVVGDEALRVRFVIYYIIRKLIIDNNL